MRARAVHLRGTRFARSALGFTLIELLVVMLIVAILTAVALPIFLGQKEKGYQDQMISALKNAATAVEAYSTEHGGNYSGLDGDDGSTITSHGFASGNYNYLSSLEISATNSTYCIEATHSQAEDDWKEATYQSSNGVAQPLPDTCP